MAEKGWNNLYDVAVIGGGPAGLTAALYLARARYRVVVLEKERFGGQITITSEVVNYPGVEKTSGAALTETMRQQAQSFGAEFMLVEVIGLDLEGDVKTIHTSRGEIRCFGVLLATGAHPRMVGFEGEADFRGHGVAYCATCDGEFFTGKEVFVVGGGFVAAEEGVFLTKYAKHVTILIRGEDFSCAKSAAEAARNHEKITVLTNAQVEAVAGDSVLRYLRYKNTKTGQITEYRAAEGDTFGVFVFAGYQPATGLLRGIAQLDDHGYVITDRNQKTSVEGLYAAGDVCVKNLRQVVTAVGDGAAAATELEKYAALMQEKTGLRPERPAEVVGDGGQTARTNAAGATGAQANGQHASGGQSKLFSPDIEAQLQTVFARMENRLVLTLYLDERPVSAELKAYMTELAKYTEKLSVTYAVEDAEAEERPCVRICREDGSWTGMSFHGVPGGHEFTSFVLGLYNAAGPGQAIDEENRRDIQKIAKPVRLQVLVSLSCTMCPELVTAAGRIAAENDNVTAEIYDMNHFPQLKDRYQVMSVPCLVIDEKQVSFGRKNIRQLLDMVLEA